MAGAVTASAGRSGTVLNHVRKTASFLVATGPVTATKRQIAVPWIAARVAMVCAALLSSRPAVVLRIVRRSAAMTSVKSSRVRIPVRRTADVCRFATRVGNVVWMGMVAVRVAVSARQVRSVLTECAVCPIHAKESSAEAMAATAVAAPVRWAMGAWMVTASSRCVCPIAQEKRAAATAAEAFAESAMTACIVPRTCATAAVV